MNQTQTQLVARLMLVVLILMLAPVRAEAAGSRLEGLVLDLDGRAATDHVVHLIDLEGRDVAQSSTSDDGVYRFRDLASGEYSLGIEHGEGRVAPVAAPPVRLGHDQLARRDIKLIRATGEEQADVGKKNRSFGVFWASLSPVAKAGMLLGTVVVLGVTVQALDDESRRSPDGGE